MRTALVYLRFFFTMQFEEALTLINHPQISAGVATTWADLGSGTGLFTNALASLLMPGSRIYAVDKEVDVFKTTRHAKEIALEKIKADFTKDILNVHDLDGILMANSLHFVSKKVDLLNTLRKYFNGKGTFLIVEYDTDKSNPWVPYPISFHSLRKLFTSLGFDHIEKVNHLPSRYGHGYIYSALVTQ